jgi:hypothetical protein
MIPNRIDCGGLTWSVRPMPIWSCRHSVDRKWLGVVDFLGPQLDHYLSLPHALSLPRSGITAPAPVLGASDLQ